MWDQNDGVRAPQVNVNPPPPPNPNPWGVRFNDGRVQWGGLFLIRMIGNPTPAKEVMLVRRYDNGRKLILKCVRGQGAANYIHNVPPEAYFYGQVRLARLQGRVPGLYGTSLDIGHIAGDYSSVFDFCNGGDLDQLTTVFGRKRRVIPEVFIWHVLAWLVETLAGLHQGWRPNQVPGLPVGHVTILHKGVAANNIMLNFHQSTDQPQSIALKRLPDVLLTDFGKAVEVPNHDFITPADDNQAHNADHWTIDISDLGNVLRNMVVAHKKSPNASDNWEQEMAGSYSGNLRRWVGRLSPDNYDQLPTAVYLARNLLPDARRHIQETYATPKRYPRNKWIANVIRKTNITTSSKPMLVPRANVADIPHPRPAQPWTFFQVDPHTYQ